MLNLSNDQLNNILERYYKGESPALLEKEFDIATGSIAYIRKKLKKPAYKNPIYSDDYLFKIINEHINGKLMKDIEKEYGINNTTIYRFMKKHNIEFKNQHGRKNNFNQNYFSNIDHQNKAYWLGFIYADGCVLNTGSGNTKTNRLTLNISYKDIELLYAFCKDINYSNSKINIYKPNNTFSDNLMCKLSCNSIKLCQDLNRLGVFQNKTGNLTSLPPISQDMMSHFLRGFFDGDGWSGKKTVAFVGDYIFLDNINHFLHTHISTSLRTLKNETRRTFPIYYLKYHSKSDIKKIYNFFYNDAALFLKRKKETFDI